MTPLQLSASKEEFCKKEAQMNAIQEVNPVYPASKEAQDNNSEEDSNEMKQQ